ncbi:hypothetical protein ACM26V_16285 [Salipaludibacillus sp. HK11]|uniref:hypothetical protein n=1 Tax=Salipaludibacillus sp. HK11 TaxID=3394320 RepID=UPI0039FCFF19
MKAKQMMICLTIIACFLGACNNQNPPEEDENVQGQADGQFQEIDPEQTAPKKDWMKSLFGPGPANYGFIGHRSDPYDPEIESNVTGKSFRSLNAPRQTDGDDQNLIEATILDLPGYTPNYVILVGGHAWVNVTAETGLNQEQLEQQIAYIKRELTKANPRYEYEVTVNGATTGKEEPTF